ARRRLGTRRPRRADPCGLAVHRGTYPQVAAGFDVKRRRDAVDDLQGKIDKLNAKITEYQTQNPPQLKNELDGVMKKRDAAVPAYKDKYQGLLSRWKTMHGIVMERLDALNHLYTQAKRDEILQQYACPVLVCVYNL